MNELVVLVVEVGGCLFGGLRYLACVAGFGSQGVNISDRK